MIVSEKRRVTSQITAQFPSSDFVFLFPIRFLGSRQRVGPPIAVYILYWEHDY